ncbi:methyltransferase domain-containing protein [Streptomyces sp. S1A1-7]|nr:class I SAM-dependent methyltransferase [Streptomyces sp. S1A1-7]QDN82428.1 methyltransferase domain-containing protein [Streptomyces sp. S1A1-7]
MGDQKNPNDKRVADAQRAHWQAAYTQRPQMYGTEPSEPARHAAEVFRTAGASTVLELGAGHGREALFLARKGFTVHATDFSATALEQLTAVARGSGLADRITTTVHDVRDPLPVPDSTACLMRRGRSLEKEGWRCRFLAGAGRLQRWHGTDLSTSFADIAKASRAGLSAVNDLVRLRDAFVRAGAGRRCLPPRPAAAGRRCSAAGERDRCAAAQAASLPCPVRAGQDRDEGRQKSCTTIQGRGPRGSKTELSTGDDQYSSAPCAPAH